ncbi:unnamed protein product [Malus baccata var. baccata]
MTYKGNADEDAYDDTALPSLLKRLPKDFGDGASINYFDDEEEDENGDYFSTMIIKLDRNMTTRRSRDFKRASFDDDEDGNGTVVRRTSSSVGSMMSIAVASMKVKLNLQIQLRILHRLASLLLAIQLGNQLVEPLR